MLDCERVAAGYEPAKKGRSPERDAAFVNLAPRAGFEPATDRLTVDCSTTELPGNVYRVSIFLLAPGALTKVMQLSASTNRIESEPILPIRPQTPSSKTGRIALGSLLIVGGVLGFLPVLGFWMIPLGLIILSHDFPVVRRFRRRWTVRFKRCWNRLG